jgi:hypothetical protein
MTAFVMTCDRPLELLGTKSKSQKEELEKRMSSVIILEEKSLPGESHHIALKERPIPLTISEVVPSAHWDRRVCCRTA